MLSLAVVGAAPLARRTRRRPTPAAVGRLPGSAAARPAPAGAGWRRCGPAASPHCAGFRKRFRFRLPSTSSCRMAAPWPCSLPTLRRAVTRASRSALCDSADAPDASSRLTRALRPCSIPLLRRAPRFGSYIMMQAMPCMRGCRCRETALSSAPPRPESSEGYAPVHAAANIDV